MRTKLIVANWKMNFTIVEALKFFAGLRHEFKGVADCEVVVCPPFTALYAFDEAFAETPYKLGAQNMHWEEAGPFTGEVSPNFLKELNVQYVILGHSERRTHFGETDQGVNKKVDAALQKDLIPIVCVGETKEEYEQGAGWTKVESQMKKTLDGQGRGAIEKMVWAYEPIWAIGTGKHATPEHAQKMAEEMRNLLTRSLDGPTAQTMRILYGGSVSGENAESFLHQRDIDGLLVGGASLDPKVFAGIIGAV